MKQFFKRWFKFFRNAVISILVLFFLALFIPNLIINNAAKNKTFGDVSVIEKNKVGMLLGTSKYYIQGGVNMYFKYRIDATVELYKEGKIEYILVSGDNGTPYYNEPKDIREALLKRGIPTEKIILDYAGFRTLDSVIRAKKVFGQSKITIISQKFQNERAIYLAQKHGLEAIGFNAKDLPFSLKNKTRLREYFARTKAVFDILFKVEPKYLGEKIEIK